LGHDVADKTKEYLQAKAMAMGLLKNTKAVSKGKAKRNRMICNFFLPYFN